MKKIIDCEATADPIFLLQSRVVSVLEPPLGWVWNDEGHFSPDYPLYLGSEGMEYPSEENCPDTCLDTAGDSGVTLSYQAVQKRGGENCSESWRTERVFLTREEGEAWAEARSYDYPLGYRVYCVPAIGELSTLLDTVRLTK